MRRRAWFSALAIAPAVALLSIAADGPKPAEPTTILKGGTVVDGTGAPPRKADLAFKGERIVGVGEIDAKPGDRVIDATGLVVAPGFIDLHSHSDNPIVAEDDACVNRNSIARKASPRSSPATAVRGRSTSSGTSRRSAPRIAPGTNVIHLIPQGDVREAVLGTTERKPDAAQMRAMKQLVEKGMRAGAWGMSSGLIYLPGRYAETAELVALSEVVAAHGGIYASHIRDEGAGLIGSIREAIDVGKGAGLPVHISHLKATGKKNWGLTKDACTAIEEARKAGLKVTADQYPYVASSTSLSAMVVPHWAAQGNAADFARIADDHIQGSKLRAAIQDELADRDGGASIRIARHGKDPSIVGLDLAEIARRRGTSVIDVVIDIQRKGGAQAISFGMGEDDVRDVMRHPYVATASDGSAHRPGGGDKPHPRAYGTFPRKFRYALDDGLMSLEQAVRSCSGLPADILGLPDRGTIRSGNVADLVVFDPKTFRDAATWDEPTRYATGLKYLFVNGVAAVAEGKPVPKVRPGRALRLDKDGPAKAILKVGRIWTGDPSNPRAEALAIRDGAIVAIGSAEEADRFRGPRTRVIDHPAGFAMPGLIDAHGHLEGLGASHEEVDLRGVSSLDEVARRVKAKMEAVPGDGWVVGNSFDQSRYPGGAFPDASTLDAVAPTRPVLLRRLDGHAIWVNSEAMRRAKVTKDSKAPADGQVFRDKEGNPTGIFVDGAMDLIYRAVPDHSSAEIARRLLAGQADCLKAGLTGVHDAGVSKSEIDAYQMIDRDGRLKLRVYGMATPTSGEQVEFVSRPVPQGWQGKRFHVRSIKLFIDGAMGSRGGLLFEPYSDDPGNSGLQLIDENTLRETTVAALKHGWQVNTHAIGDKGNALVLDAYASALKAVPGVRDARLRIEHAQVVRKADVARFKGLSVIASMQPSHASDDMRWADARLGPDRVQGAYAWHWFLDAGVPLAFGSDFPVEVVNPFYGLYAALTRQDETGSPPEGWHPDQRMTLDEALHAFTAGSAYAAFEENKVGVLKIGMRADVTVVDRDLFAVNPIDLLHAKVTETIVDGEIAFAGKPAGE